MSNEKHSSRRKHSHNIINEKENRQSQATNLKKKSLNKIFLLFLILIIISILVFEGYQYFREHPLSLPSSGNVENSEALEEYEEASEKVETKETLSVKGAEYLEITGLYINSDNPELSTVSAKLRNNSDKSYENVNIRITLFDKDNKEITFLDYKIDRVEANGEASTYAALKRDLSICVNYSIALKNSK